MTAHNVADYIEAVFISLLRQTWQPLEIIVVDDASTDETWHILQRIQGTHPIVIRRLNTNLGTYFAKNYGVQMANGEFVFFQDGDDLCHPERIRLSMQELNQPGVVCVQASYSRVSFPEGRVYPVNGQVKKLGLITLGLRKSVFDQIGYFNCTRKASDDELFQRLQAYCQTKGGEIRTLDLPLYYNTLREGSLFTDMISNDHVADGHIDQRPSPARAAYVDAFRRQQAELRADRFRDFYRYPVLRDLIEVAPDLSCLPNPCLPVVASLCSVPERAELLKLTLASLTPQVDQLHLYLDRYDAIPEIVRNCHPNLSVVLSRDRPGLRDNGKFLPFEPLKKECYYFTIDDDIIYPPDYVAAMIRKIDEYGRQAVIGVHGILIPEQATCYFSGFRKVHGFIQALERDALVNILGTGTVAFHSGLLQGLRLDHFSTPGMTDLYLASFCKQRGIPMLCIARHNEWLIEQESPNQSLFAEYCQADEPQSALIRNTRPWGYAAIRQAVSAVGRRTNPDLPVAHEKLAALMPVLHPCL
ncbi:MAG: glycosyltransferase family 2 protein [Gammaproteobacteria bacterium]|nr:glycosyltransferase family 2 protein [Gammaproteobacteria bacterium]